MSETRDIEGTLDFKGAVELGKILAKAKVEGSAGATAILKRDDRDGTDRTDGCRLALGRAHHRRIRQAARA